MRIATFNAENMFTRPSIMNLDTWAEGRDVLTDVDNLNTLLANGEYTPAIKDKIKKILDKYDFKNRNKKGRPFEINEVREKLFKVKQKTNEIEIVPEGRDSWVGWVQLPRDQMNWEAVENTARVIKEVNADIILTVEVEDRITLDRFNKQVIGTVAGAPYEHNMLVDGNDPRGIDLGLLSRRQIISVRSHIDDGAPNTVFSRDCPEFEISLPNGKTFWLLGNHLKSKGYGAKDTSNQRRQRQAEEVKRIYEEARRRSDYVIVAGDLNDTPDSPYLAPLLKDTDLQDVMSHSSYDGKPGTYKTSKDKIDYILLSPKLWDKVTLVGTERGGIYAPRAGNPYETVTSLKNQASDHAAVWVEIDV